MKKHRGSVLTIFLCFLLTACGEAGQVVKQNIDPCSLVSTQEAGQILGTPMTAHQEFTSSGGGSTTTTCAYSSASRTDHAALQLHIFTDSSSARSTFQFSKSSDSPSVQSLHGLGEDAYFYAFALPDNIDLEVLKDNAILSVMAGHERADLGIDKQFAQIALKRL
ncbi:hypothetical protein KSF_046500 [Reticulibacter mediterranei]|uniref:Lipoprotein n=1 Tax=Reticulibacter mediterranei TaxID=2778369 RepID=A0A8J3IPC2_9CHLR|nr:hypothetical protein [Reticulibacter mediterranei]GHO94602.1 hypothetical protein KSF_046500 [Reticulibacter mediterranei]